jgi:hypothetical protein
MVRIYTPGHNWRENYAVWLCGAVQDLLFSDLKISREVVGLNKSRQ